MGVINNLIAIRRKFRAIVGDDWNGVTLSNINKVRPIPRITRIPDTDGNTIVVGTNIFGFYAALFLIESDGSLTRIGAYASSAANNTVNLSAASITTTSKMIVQVIPYGGDFTTGVYSNEFTVTRTAAQTTSAKQNMSESLETDVIKEDLTTDETPVVEKTTNTTKKGN